MSGTRTPRQLDELRRRIATVAERIRAGRFEPRENPLCNWCEFRPRCPLWRHERERDDPRRIAEAVDEWIRLERERRERSDRMNELASTIRAYAEEHGIRRLLGTDGAVQIVDRVESAPDPDAVRRALEPLGLYESVLRVDPRALDELIRAGTLPPGVEDALLASGEPVRTTAALSLREGRRAASPARR